MVLGVTDVLADVAFAALALLVAVLAIYLAIRLLGKLAKFVIILVLIVLAVWLVFSDKCFLHQYFDFLPTVFATRFSPFFGFKGGTV